MPYHLKNQSLISTFNNGLLNQFINYLLSFIWNGKADQNKRETISQIYELGRLYMLNLILYINGLKLTVIRGFNTQTNKYCK